MNHIAYFGIGHAEVASLAWLLAAVVVAAVILAVLGACLALAMTALADARVSYATHRRRYAEAVLGDDWQEGPTDEADTEPGEELPEPVPGFEAKAEPAPDPWAQFVVSFDAPINSLQVESIRDLVARAKRAHTIDVCIRKDGVEQRFEADWLKHIVEQAGIATPEERESQRRSFVYGNTKLDFPAVTREMVDQEAAAHPTPMAWDRMDCMPVGVVGQKADEIHGVQEAYDAYAKHEHGLNARPVDREDPAGNERPRPAPRVWVDD